MATDERRPRLRDAMLALEDAVVELHAEEERAANRRETGGDVVRARELYLRARSTLDRLRSLDEDERRRANALLDTVGLLLALRESAGAASLAGKMN